MIYQILKIMADPIVLRDIAIKTGVVKRLIKELCYYEKEEEKLMNKLQTMQASDNADEHIVKKQIELLQETKQMIPECARRLMNSIENLKKAIGEHETVLQNTAEYIAAAEQIKTGTNECLKIKEAMTRM
ncbi:Tubulin-specific chaperone [Dirofilaria immitis]